MTFLFKSHKAAGIIAGCAFGAFFLVQKGYLAFFPDNCVNRANLLAGAALDTFVLNYLPQEQFFTAVGRAAFFVNMCFVFVAEIVDCGKDRIWRCLPETAERRFFDGETEILKGFDI